MLPKTFDLKNEQLDGKTYGTVTASWVDGKAPSWRIESVPGEVYREWFFVPSGRASAVVSTAKKQSRWFDGKEPTTRRCEWSGGELSGRVHMPDWCNHPNSIPGSFFAFSCRRDTSRYTKEDLEDVFCGTARPLVGGTTSAVDGRPLLRGEWLATGLMIFGKSVQYQGDRTVDSSEIVERFSSTARLDGLGDCEDIAKETAMAHADLIAIEGEWARAKKITETCVDMCALVEEAKKYVCAIALCTVRRSEDSRIEAHAFAMLLPKCAFSDHEGGRDSRADRSAFVADGTYPCDPSSKNVPREGVRPWKYEHVVSALVYGEGEIYFRYVGEPKNYGVLADDLFPFVSNDVVIEWGYHVRDREDRDAIERVLASNLPTTARTFQHENETIGHRFRKLVRWHEIDTKKKIQERHRRGEETNSNRGRGVPNLVSVARCLRGSYEIHGGARRTRGRRRRAGSKPRRRGVRIRSHGRGVANPFHTHHRPTGHVNYLDHNPPTPDDVATFVAGRAAGFLVRARGTEEERRKVQTTSTVITRNNRYEMSSTDDANDAVTALWLKGMTDGYLKTLNEFESLRNALVPFAMEMAKSAVTGEGKWAKYDDDGNPTLVVDITKKENEKQHDAYLRAYEESMGVRVSYLDNEEFKKRCGLD